MFLFTDSQIVDERMLVYINDLLSSGEIPDLFPQVGRRLRGARGCARLQRAGIPVNTSHRPQRVGGVCAGAV